MPPPRAPIDVARLTKPFGYIARQLGQHFPTSLLDQDDLMQQAFLGALSVTYQAKETERRRLQRQVRAGKCEVIDALRACHDNRSSLYGRRHERLVPDIVHLADLHQNIASADDTRTRYRDLCTLAATLSARNQAILWSRLRGYTLQEVADHFHISEVRAWQLQQQIVRALRRRVGQP